MGRKIVYARRRSDWVLYVLDRVSRAGNGNIDLTGRPVEGGPAVKAGWWRWWIVGTLGFEACIEALSLVPGWRVEYAGLIREGAMMYPSSRQGGGPGRNSAPSRIGERADRAAGKKTASGGRWPRQRRSIRHWWDLPSEGEETII